MIFLALLTQNSKQSHSQILSLYAHMLLPKCFVYTGEEAGGQGALLSMPHCFQRMVLDLAISSHLSLF